MKTAVVQAQQKWECTAVTAFSDQALLHLVNDGGQQGWEPFSTVYYKDLKGSMVWTAFLRRPCGSAPGKAAEPTSGEVKVESPEPSAVRNPAGFDLDGDTFDIKEEPKPEIKPDLKPALKPDPKSQGRAR